VKQLLAREVGCGGWKKESLMKVLGRGKKTKKERAIR
jgi:hypothetical protein